ncbi:hypothetical protein OG389_12565 [Streptomyces sp. NBC_00435]|uniref:hypothetical protein n=1 Tax=Streptomyces sp. NBC_00435 TaxID=2903649 RepID=UPI002E212437
MRRSRAVRLLGARAGREQQPHHAVPALAHREVQPVWSTGPSWQPGPWWAVRP